MLFINQEYRKKHCKISRRRGCVLTQRILKNTKQLFEEIWVLLYTTYYQKYELTEDEPMKECKNLRLSRRD